MQIGKLAQSTGTDTSTIRYYEQQGLLPQPERTASGYRDYDKVHCDTLQFIRHCRSLDMPLSDIRTLLEYRSHPTKTCTAVIDVIAAHRARVQERLAQLQQFEEQLVELEGRCTPQRKAEHCGILNRLDMSARETFGANLNSEL